MTAAPHENINGTEKGIRFVLGGTMIASVLVNPAMPVWLAIVAIYPVSTAIINWDPLYAAVIGLYRDVPTERFVPVRNPF